MCFSPADTITLTSAVPFSPIILLQVSTSVIIYYNLMFLQQVIQYLDQAAKTHCKMN